MDFSKKILLKNIEFATIKIKILQICEFLKPN